MTAPTEITDAGTLERALGAERFLLFKHSPVCPISARAFREYERFVAEEPDVPTGFVNVIAGRPLSLRAAEATGVAHESPQALLIRDGAAVWSASHGAITLDSLLDAVAER